MTKTKEKRPRIPVSKRYEFQKPIGSGGMGTVYRALDRETGEPVAIKVLNENLSENPTLYARFVREFKAAHELDHPNIVRALAFANDGGDSFVVYELVEGCSLGDRVEKEGKIEEADAVRIITQIAQALHYAHQRQVVHRDVKPDNILILPDGRVKLTDFGLAKDHSATDDPFLTRAASGLGTPHFMAPEQFADARSAGRLCDVYSLGATLYNLLTGEYPFDAKTPLVILAKKEMGNLAPARNFVHDLSEHVETAIRAAVDPDPAKRPQSCLEFFKQLNSRSKSSENVVATPMPLLAPRSQGDNRRACIRYPIKVGTLAFVDVGLQPDGASEEEWPLVVQDVSSGGMKLLLARRFEPGSEIAIELVGEGKPRRFPVRVVRVKQDRAGHWLHGCSFLKALKDADVKLLLKMS